MIGDAGNDLVSYKSSIPRIATVGNVSRSNSEISGRWRARVTDCDAAVCAEWAKLSKNRPGLNLPAIIGIASHRHAIWPLGSEFTKFAVKGEGKWSGEWARARSYETPGKAEKRYT